MRASIFTDAARQTKRTETAGTVLRAYGEFVDVRTSSGSVLPRVPIVGAAEIGETVTLKHQEGVYVAYGGSFKGSAAAGGVTVINNGSTTTGGGGGVGTGAPSPHGLNSAHHSGTLAYVQLPTLNVLAGTLLTGGGNVASAGSVTLNIDTSKLEVTAGKLVKSSAGTLTLDSAGSYTLTVPATGTAALGAGTLNVATINSTAGANHTHAVTASAYPGAAASLMATDASGYMGVQRLGIGSAANASYAIYSLTASPSLFSGQVESVNASATPQFKATYNASNYTIIGAGSSGSLTIGTAGSSMAAAHINLNPGGGSANVSIGNAPPTPTAKFEINNGSGDQLKLNYSGSVYWAAQVASGGNLTLTPASSANLVVSTRASIGGPIAGQGEQLRLVYDSANSAAFNVSSTGVFTFSGYGTVAANAHALFNPGGKMGVNMTGTPAAQLEVRNNSGAQWRASYDATAYADWTVASGGNLTVTTYGSDLIFDLQPVGGLAGAKYLMPANNYDVNIGRLTKKYLSLHAAELVVENLIAFDTQSTTGGRLLITPAEVLTEDFPASASTNFITRSGATSANQTSSSSWVLTPPGGAVTGDLLIVWMTLQTAATVTPPAGWTQIGSTQSWTAGRQTQAYYKFKQVGETTYTFTLSANKAGLWMMASYANVDTSTPIDASGFQTNAPSSSHPAPTVTTARDWDILIYFASYTSTTAQFTPPTGMAELIDAPNASTTCTNFMAEELRYGAGATGTRTATAGLPTYNSCTASIALKAQTVVPLTGKYNNLTIGDVLHFEAGGHVEFAQVYAGPLSGANNKGPYKYLVTRNLDGTGANDWVAGDVAVNMGQAGAGFIDLYSWWSAKGAPFEFIYNYDGSTFSDNLTLANNWNLFRPAGGTVAVNDAIYFGMGGGYWANVNLMMTTTAWTTFAGTLEYWNGSAWTALVGAVTTNYAATTGAASVLTTGNLANSIPGVLTHTWDPLAQTGWAKNTVNGQLAYWVRWRATTVSGLNAAVGRRVMRGAVQYGPTIVGNVRSSTTYNDWSERWAIGNLHGLYDYGKISYGFAAGVYSGSWIAADADNGIRIMKGIASRGQWDMSGNIRIGEITNGQSRVEISAAGVYSVINRQAAVDTTVGSWDASGNITVGAVANSKSRIFLSTAGKISMYARNGSGVDVERFYVDTSGNMRLIGDASNYVNVDGATGVLTVSGAINVIGTIPNTSISGLGTLATASSVAWGSQVTGRPMDNAGALVTAASPSGAGLYLGSSVLGFYSASQWQVYIDNSGNFLFRGPPSASVNVGAVWWHPSSGRFRGGYFAPAAGPNYGAFTTQWYTDALTGAISAGAGAVIMDASGLSMAVGGSYSDPAAYKFYYSGTRIGYLAAWRTGTDNHMSLAVDSPVGSGLDAYAGLSSSAVASKQAQTQITATAGALAQINLYSLATNLSSIDLTADTVSVVGPLRANVGSSSWKTPLSVGSTSNDYTATNAKYTANAADFANIVLNGADYTSIAFHDSGHSIGIIKYSARVFTIGEDATTSNLCRTNIVGQIGETWTSASYAANWQSASSPYGGLQYKKIGDMVFVRGLVQRITSNAAAGTAIATFPSGYRPARQEVFICWGTPAGADKAIRVDVTTGGGISCPTDAINTSQFVSLEFYFSTV